MSHKLLILPGDGIGPEIVAQAIKVLQVLRQQHDLDITWTKGLIGGSAYDATGKPLPDETLDLARESDAILLGAVGGPQWEKVERGVRPERGLLAIRSALTLFANLRPAILYPQLAAASSLHAELVAGLDIMLVRELTGGIYFGRPRGIGIMKTGERAGFNTMFYRESEIERIMRMAFSIAMQRHKRVCSVDKANVLEVSELWREVATRVANDFPHVQLTHFYVDNAAMQLVRAPKQFDVIVTSNLFGDILSDCAAMLTGSIGMLPSASLGADGRGMYEPIHGSAPDIAGNDSANPLATILSLAMMLRFTLHRDDLAKRVEHAVGEVLDQGLRTADIMADNLTKVGTHQMGDAVAEALSRS